MTDSPILVWFRRDLRLADNPALAAAAKSGRPIVACYVLDDSHSWAPGGASRWWLHRSLASLRAAIAGLGGQLVLRRGAAPEEIPRLAAEVGAAEVCAAEVPLRQQLERDRATRDALRAQGAELRLYPGALLYGADPVRTGSGGPFRVFTPFWRACSALPEPKPPLPFPQDLRFVEPGAVSDELDEWSLTPRSPDWAQGFAGKWTPGEDGAHERLDGFVESALGHYAGERDRPDLAGTSALSPHLAFGELSPRQIWHAVQSARAGRAALDTGADAWLRQLVWREFSYYLLHHWPDFPEAPFRPAFADFPWRDDAAGLESWQRGKTGYPIVDAGMRELWQTGWMHNRVRMVVASFLIKDLLIPWQAGEAWFWDTLVDADLANNAASWQWVAGCGADAAPYFRIFNPVTQGRKFDPEGVYVRRFVPEIAALPDRYLHAPWTAPRDVLDQAGIRLGSDYPEPIVDHAEARKRALAAFKTLERDTG